MDSPQTFVDEIDFKDLQIRKVVGKGAFGVVSHARWQNKDVAVKLIETESEKKAFITELKQLSRVSHPNIVRLYGASTKHPVCLVMEYAEGGSLYNVLHGSGPQPDYTTSHALSWALQCALGVEYLHNMKPKALIHRDLKPPNLLLIIGGTVLKICDFGTACDQQTHMTNNKGSAAWMAPEVFEGCNYTEKCDVFSWGIILWEVLTRRKPFDEIGGPAFRIMWAVHSGTRPPMIQNLPEPLKKLMKCCWSAITMERPSMSEVVRVMTGIMKYFHGHHEHLVYPDPYSEIEEEQQDSDLSEDMHNTSTMTSQKPAGSRVASIRDTVREALYQGRQIAAPRAPGQRIIIEEEPRLFSNLRSAPASLAASRESLLDTRGPPPETFKRYSADLSNLDEIDLASPSVSQHTLNRKLGHRRSGSYGATVGKAGSESPPRGSDHRAARGHRRGGSDEYSNINAAFPHPAPAPPTHSLAPITDHSLLPNRSTSWTPGVPVNFISDQVPNLDALNAVLDNQLQPIAPSPLCQESLAIFEEHCRVAEEYLRVQIEIELLVQRKRELLNQCDQDQQTEQNSYQMADEYNKLKLENENLIVWHKDLKNQQQRNRSQSIT